MNRLRHQIFAGSAISQDQYRRIASRYQLRHVVNPLHGGRAANHSGQRGDRFMQGFGVDDLSRASEDGVISQ